MPDLSLDVGTLLVAPPVMHDPNFRRTVVLLCDHGTSGSFGLILNRMLDTHLGEILSSASTASYDARLAMGGPVQPNTLHYLHRLGDDVPGAIPVADGVHWGGDFKVIKRLVRRGDAHAQSLRFFLGYAGWSPEQLQHEADESGWLLVPAADRLVFPDDPAALWRTVMQQMGGEYALLSTFPDDPRMN